MQEMNLDVAGEFLVMAATLIHIKSRMLLPRPDPTQEDPEEDPREALDAPAARAPEVQGRRRAAARARDPAQRAVDAAGRPDRRDRRRAAGAGDRGRSLQPDQRAFAPSSSAPRRGRKVYLPAEQIPIEERIEQLMERLSETEACGFEDLFEDVQTRAGLVVTFLALLEMIRLKLIRVFQTRRRRAHSRLQARPAGRCAASPLHDPEQVHAQHVAAMRLRRQGRPRRARVERRAAAGRRSP